MITLTSENFCCLLDNDLGGSIASYNPSEGASCFPNDGAPCLSCFYRTEIIITDSETAWSELCLSSPDAARPSFKEIDRFVLLVDINKGWATKSLIFPEGLERKKFLTMAKNLPGAYVVENAPVIFSLEEIYHFYEPAYLMS